MTALFSRLRYVAALSVCACAVLGASLLSAPSALADTTDNYSCTAGPQTSTVPSGDNLVIVTLNGASGGSAANNGVTSTGGAGEKLTADVPVTAGSQLDVVVGCQGGSVNGGNGALGGYGGGGTGGNGDNGSDGSLSGGGGGGASYVMPTGGAFTSVYAIASGGGGAGNTGGYLPGPFNGAGGAGGNAESNGADGGPTTDGTNLAGAQGGASGNNGGAGGQGGLPGDNNGGDGSAGQGGDGGNYDSYDGGAGGGGGGGLTGGGGGGYGGDGNQTGPGGGGGGGGQGGVQNGATLVGSDDNAITGNGSVSITYTVAAGISVTPSSQDFGTVTDGQSSAHTFSVTDTGEQSLVIGQLTENGGEFTLVAGQDRCSGQAVTSGQSCTFAVSFAPTSAGSQTGTVEVPSNAASTPSDSVNLAGTGQQTPAQVSLSDSSESYGTVTVGQSATRTVTVTNSGQEPLDVGQATVAEVNAGQFAIVSGQDTCSGQTVAGGGTCSITVAFSPTSTGVQTASLSVLSNDPASPATVALSGAGQAVQVAPTPTPPALKLVERLTAVGTPTTTQLFTRGEKVQVHCNQGCSVDVTLEVYHRAVARGKHYRGLLHAEMAREPWTRVTVAQTVVTMRKAGTETVYVKLAPAVKKALSYAGSILLGVYTEPASSHGAVSKHWVNVPGPDMNAQVAARQHGR